MMSEKEPDKPRFSRRKRLLFWGALISAILALAVLLPELTLRILYCQEEIYGNYWGSGAFERDEALGFRHAAGFQGRAYRRDVFDCPITIQPNNLRQANYESQIRYPRKLLILGDSFAFGLGVSEESAFPTLLQPRLNAEGIGVINGAQTAYCVQQEVGFGRWLAEAVRPDVVILCLYTNNDVMADYHKGYESVVVKYGYRLRKNRWWPIAPIDYLRTHSYVCMFVAHQSRKARRQQRLDEYKQAAVSRTDEMIQPTLDALREFNGYCRSHNVAFGVVMIPSSGYSPFDAPLKRAFTKEGIPLVDLPRSAFTGRYCFRGDAHWNKEGHKNAAAYIAPFCLDLLRSK